MLGSGHRGRSMKLKIRIWEIVEVAKPGDKASRVFDVAILALIFLNVVAVIIGSVQAVEDSAGAFLNAFETFSVVIFSAEYIARLWSCTVGHKANGPLWGRVRFALRPMSIVDLLAILPFYLPFVGVDLRTLRVLRLLRILRIVKAGRYYSSLQLIRHVVKAKKEELVLSSALMGILLIISSSVLYFCENAVQPEVFSSIPATMWWAVATLTTVGYGDMYPLTIMGRFFASIIAMLGIGMFALPTGILGAGFVEEIQKSKQSPQRCPHCGKDIV
jgi:voltage-gated potassium channel